MLHVSAVVFRVVDFKRRQNYESHCCPKMLALLTCMCSVTSVPPVDQAAVVAMSRSSGLGN